MRRILAITLFFLGLGLFAAVSAVRVKEDRDRLERQLGERREAALRGWETRWREHLLGLARAGSLPHTYELVYDRSGTERRTPFFPARPVALDWSLHREARTAGDRDAARRFLGDALARVDSWDRVLALGLLEEAGLEPPPSEQLTPYERTLLDPEAKASYALLFRQFEKGRDFALATPAPQLDEAFYRVTPTGDVAAFLPSARALAGAPLATFLAKEGIPRATLGATPWEIRFVADLPDDGASRPRFEAVLALLGVASVGAGGLLLVAANREERRRLMSQVSFLDQVVHELKTPLTGLKLHVDLLRRHGPRESSLAAVQESTERLDRLFSDIAALNHRRARAEREVVPAEALAAILGDVAGATERCALEGPRPTRAVCGTKTAIEIILRNLVTNGVAYGDRVTVTVREGARTEILVRDRGPGIDRRAARRVFDELYRAEGARRARPDGLGLGLAVAKRLAADMGATLTLDNAGEPGALFRLSLERADA